MAAIISGYIDTYSLIEMKKNKDLVKKFVKPERIRLEILKAMKTQYPSTFFYYLKVIGLLDFIFPSLSKTINLPGGVHHGETVFAHSMIVGNVIRHSKKTADKLSLIRLSGFLHDVGKPDAYIINNKESFNSHEKIGSELVKQELKNLRFTNLEIEYISELINIHMRFMSNKVSPKAIRKFIILLNKYNIHYQDWLRLRVADRRGNLRKDNYTLSEIKSYINSIENILTEEKFVSKLSLLKMNGNDVINITGLKQGKEIGIILNKLLDIVIEDPSQNTKEILTQKIGEIYENI